MTTYGPGSRRNPPKQAAMRSSSRSSANGSSRSTSPGKGGKAPSSRRDQATVELRNAISGREDEFLGVGLIAIGLLIGLAIYVDLAGPLGRGIETLVGWFTGLGRFVVPIALVGIGVALVRQGRSEHRYRLIIGWGLAALSVLGLLHVVRGPEKWWADADAFGTAGGWFGAIVGEPLRSLLANAGAIVVFIALFIGGVLLITGSTIRALMSQTGRGMGAVALPLGKAARRARTAFDGVTTLRSERDTGDHQRPGPSLYDAAAAADDVWDDVDAPAKPKRARAKLAPPVLDDASPGQQSELQLGPGAQRGPWVLPPVSYLLRSESQTINKAEVEARGRTLVDSLDSHGVETKLLGQTVGPTVTRYELELGSGVKVARITSLNRDIAYAMAATDVRILAPIPGRSAIGVEVPNHTRQLVALGDIMTSAESKTSSHPLDVAVGKDIAGRSVFLNLATTPHLLIAGATGAGKSSGINCIITSLLMRSTPDQVKLILIDPKQVEMGQYNKLPHLLTAPVTNPKKAANALSWAVKEMERRYDLLFEVGFRDITGYNAAYDRGELQGEGVPLIDPDDTAKPQFERLPYIVVVVDELNDLMMVAARDVEESITRIAQKARAVGIHLIVATQRPSVNVITGVIKANVPARMAFAVSSLTDSRVILDQPGAEKLVGKGDMLLLPGNSNVAQRIQGSFVSEEEVRRVVNHWRKQGPEPVYVSGVEGDEDGGGGASLFSSSGGGDDDDENLMRQAVELVVRSQLGSTSMLQRKLKVGFARAGRLMDLLETRGIVGPSEGSKARAVLMTVEEFELLVDSGGL
ncbi:MAG: FtsK/SpoIIIE family proteinFtsk gamma protein [Ilumatobacteraceae bacterium]|nr:FtsK/SpoIIIE family proteinFtsk gamma protein [Ilumatobacteraceae bacterium]